MALGKAISEGCSMKWSIALGVLVVFTGCIFTGCTGASRRVVSPEVDPNTAATAAIAQYDTDGDSVLSKAECKGSGFDFPKWDANSDGNLNENEIVQRLRLYADHGTGLMNLLCVVTLNGRPLEDGKVVFEPESFLGDTIEAAEGTIDLDGNVTLAIPAVVAEDPVLTGIRPGLYKVKITHPNVQVPAKYNVETTLGFDASPIELLDTPVFRLRK